MESVRDYQQEGVSRADIARMTDLSRATVSVIVDEFIAKGLLEESGTGSSQGGRPPTYLRLNPRAGYVAAVDMGVSHMSATIANFNGESLAEMEMPFDITIGPERCLAEIEARLHELCLHAGCSWGAISAIAIGIPGPVLHESGMTILPPVMPNWDRFPIRQYLMDRWHKPIIIDNDADLAAMGEWTYIYKRREPNLAFVRIGTGIGAGLVLNRQLYRTQFGTAGEIGHTPVVNNGPPCACGNYGCLESVAGGRAIAQRAQQVVRLSQPTSLSAIYPVEAITVRHIVAAALQGDVVSRQLLQEAGTVTGLAIAYLVNLLNPSLVVVGGNVVEAGHIFLDALAESCKRHSMRIYTQNTRIVKSQLGARAIMMGAVSVASSVALQRLIEES